MNNLFIMPAKFISLLFLILLNSSTSFSFGKNKVQYSKHSWLALHSKYYSLYYHEKMNPIPNIANKWFDNAYKTLSQDLNFLHSSPIPLIIYGNPSLFAQTNIITELLPEGVGGFTEVFKTRIAVPFNGSYSELRHVLHHELVHAFVFGIVFEKFGAGSAMFNNAQIPFWFNEGAAEYLSSGWDCDADMFMMEQTLNSAVPLPGPALDGYLAYKGGQSFLHFLHTSRGDSAFSQFLLEFRKSKMVDNSINKIYKQSTDELGKEWIKELRRLYWPEIGQREDPSVKSSFITSHLKTKDYFNLRPRISPDGSKIAFFSDRKDYTRILITDRKGKIVHQIRQNGYGGFFESFHPFRSGLCWAPDGNRLAFVTFNKGKDELRIVDISKKRLLKKLKLPLSSISSPDWSRNGELLTFSAISEGLSDLFLYDLKSDSLIRLTESIEYESDPHFSPDGNQIVFSIEDTSGTSQHPGSPFGKTPSDLALLDLNTKKITKLTNTNWSEKQPSFSPNGKHIAFISNRNGIDNIYILSTDEPESCKPLTDFIGGCSNPDWAFNDNSIVFSLFQNQGWDVLLIEDPLKKATKDSLTNTQWVKRWYDSSSCFFNRVEIKNDSLKELKEPKRSYRKHADTSSEQVHKVSKDTTVNDTILQMQVPAVAKTDSIKLTKKHLHFSAPTDTNLVAKDSSGHSTATDTTLRNNPQPYRLKFTPDLVAFGLGMSNYYSPAGQLLLSFSDLMGDHQISVAADIQGNLKEYMHIFASYVYLRNRTDIGIGAFFNKDYSYADIFGDRLYHDQESGGFLFISYPLTMFTRFDFQVFFRDVKRKPVESEDPEIGSTVLLPSISYSFDNILWGITGPLNGIRISSTLQMSPPVDFTDQHFISFDTDIRTYLHLFKKFVWANRVFVGVSQSLKEGSSARRYFLGGNENWFSYRINEEQYERNLQNTFYSDFVTPFRGYNYLDITGSRVALLNTEFRFPFIREISLVWPLPIQIKYINGALFSDIGNAWNAGERYHGLPLPGEIYGGFGFGVRANLGMFILRFDRGWPTDWHRDVGTPKNYFSLGAEF